MQNLWSSLLSCGRILHSHGMLSLTLSIPRRFNTSKGRSLPLFRSTSYVVGRLAYKTTSAWCVLGNERVNSLCCFQLLHSSTLLYNKNTLHSWLRLLYPVRTKSSVAQPGIPFAVILFPLLLVVFIEFRMIPYSASPHVTATSLFLPKYGVYPQHFHVSLACILVPCCECTLFLFESMSFWMHPTAMSYTLTSHPNLH